MSTSPTAGDRDQQPARVTALSAAELAAWQDRRRTTMPIPGATAVHRATKSRPGTPE